MYRCVVVEDSAIGLAAAKADGMTCIVTKSGLVVSAESPLLLYSYQSEDEMSIHSLECADTRRMKIL